MATAHHMAQRMQPISNEGRNPHPKVIHAKNNGLALVALTH